MVAWARTHVHASALAGLACAFLQGTDAQRVVRHLRGGRHGQAAQCFCERFSQRHFPLDYAWAGDREARLLVEITGGIQHEGFGDNWEEYGDLWALRPVFALSWALMQDPYGALRDEYFEDEFHDKEDAGTYRLCDEAREVVAQFANQSVDALFGGVPGTHTAVRSPLRSSRVYAYFDHRLFRMLWSWAGRRHTKRKNMRWVRRRYFDSAGGRKWVFTAQGSGPPRSLDQGASDQGLQDLSSPLCRDRGQLADGSNAPLLAPAASHRRPPAV
jgi:hypothetical protein